MSRTLVHAVADQLASELWRRVAAGAVRAANMSCRRWAMGDGRGARYMCLNERDVGRGWDGISCPVPGEVR